MTPSAHTLHEPTVREQLQRWLALLRHALRFWPAVLGALLVGGLAFAVFARVRTPQYRSETVVLYVEKRSPTDSGEPTSASRSVSVRLKELLLSRSNLERVIAKFDLYPTLRSTYGNVEAVEELKKHIEFRAPGGDTFSIAFEGGSPQEAQGVTKLLAQLVIDGDAELRKAQARVALEFLVGEKRNTEAQLREAEQALASFMAQHPRFALDTTPLASGAAIRASLGAANATGPLLARRGGARLGAIPADAAARSSPVSPATPGSARAPSAEEQRARAALAVAREHLAEELMHYTPAHPDVRAARAAVESAEQRLAALPPPPPEAAPPGEPAKPQPNEAVALSTSTTGPARKGGDAVAAGRRPRAASPASPAPPAELARTMVEQETRWLTLTRAVTEAHQRQDQVEAQLFKADILASSEGGGHGIQVNVIDPAFLPQRPVPPGLLTIAALFTAGALLLGALLALLFAVLDDRLFRAGDAVGVSEILVEVPGLPKERRALVAS